MTFNSIEFSIDGPIARITLNRPESANTIGVEMAEELLQAALRCDGHPDIRAVILTAKGRFFSGAVTFSHLPPPQSKDLNYYVELQLLCTRRSLVLRV